MAGAEGGEELPPVGPAEGAPVGPCVAVVGTADGLPVATRVGGACVVWRTGGGLTVRYTMIVVGGGAVIPGGNVNTSGGLLGSYDCETTGELTGVACAVIAASNPQITRLPTAAMPAGISHARLSMMCPPLPA